MKSKIVMQVCTCFWKIFLVRYLENRNIEYMDEPCECESDFEPISGEPSISEWMETLIRK